VLLGSYSVGSNLLVTEVAKTGVGVQSISLNGAATVNSRNNNKINFTITGPGVIVITYVNESVTT
jgi:hypothetical protein